MVQLVKADCFALAVFGRLMRILCRGQGCANAAVYDYLENKSPCHTVGANISLVSVVLPRVLDPPGHGCKVLLKCTGTLP
jgi:hypothetical protein